MWVGLGFAGLLSACSGAMDRDKSDPAAGQAKPELSFRETAEPVEGAPISLSDTEGSGLKLVALRARTVIEEPIAFTELHLTFENVESRVREGRFAITLPEQAAISRFAMQVGRTWQEGEVVERKQAQTIYEDYLHRKQDPALLERDAGNQFTARVFPIAPNERKELIVAYSEELTHSKAPYRLLLKGLPRIDNLDIEVLVDAGKGAPSKLSLVEKDFVPSADLAVSLLQRQNVALRSEDLVVTRIAPSPNLTAEPIESLTILFDTSASRALSFEAQVERLLTLVQALKAQADFPLQIIAFDQTSELAFEGKASEFSARDQAKLLARDALGASNLSAALGELTTRYKPLSRVLVVSDGVITAGTDNTLALREAVAKLSVHGVRRLDALVEGGIRDVGLLTALTRAGLKSTGLVLDSRLTTASLLHKLNNATLERVNVQVENARWVYPSVLEGVQAGDEFLVFAELDAKKPVRVSLSGEKTISPTTISASALLLERAVARAKIADLEAQKRGARDAGEATRYGQEIIALSLKHRVLSELTALLVLESPNEYRRFGLKPEALANILQVGEQGIEVVDRNDVRIAAKGSAVAAVRREREEGRGEERSHSSTAPADVPMPPPAAAPSTIAPQRSRQEASNVSESWADRATTSSGAMPVQAENKPTPRKVASAASGAPGLGSSGAGPGGGGLGDRLGTDGFGGLDAATTRPVAKSSTMATASNSLAERAAYKARATARLHSASGVDRDAAGVWVRGTLAAVTKVCYERYARTQDPTALRPQQLKLEFSLSDKGTVRSVFISSGTLQDSAARACILSVAQRLQFPKPLDGSQNASVEVGVEFSLVASEPSRPAAPVAPAVARARPVAPPKPAPRPSAPALSDAYSGVLHATLEALARGDLASARREAETARASAPGDVVALIALGEALEAQGEHARAARAYGSLIDLFPSRTDLRRMAAARLERLPAANGLELALDSYEKALAQRADHPSSHRLLAYAQLKAGRHMAAFETLRNALAHSFRWDRFEAVDRILREDLSLVGAAMVRAQPSSESFVLKTLQEQGIAQATKPSLRFVLNWETDANDVDFHIYDGRGGHAYYMQRKLGSGGALYADITTGYGPECFAIEGAARAYPYTLQAHYFSRGPMGFGMGKVQVVEHDGAGILSFSEHPFTIMKDKAFVALAEVPGPLPRVTSEGPLTLGTH